MLTWNNTPVVLSRFISLHNLLMESPFNHPQRKRNNIFASSCSNLFSSYTIFLGSQKICKGEPKRGQLSLFIEKHRNLCVKISRGCWRQGRRANWCSHGRAPDSWIPGTPGVASTGVIGPAPVRHMRIASLGSPFDIEMFFSYDPIICAVSSLLWFSWETLMRFLIAVYYVLPCLIAIHTPTQ